MTKESNFVIENAQAAPAADATAETYVIGADHGTLESAGAVVSA